MKNQQKIVEARFGQYKAEISNTLGKLYGQHPDFEGWLKGLFHQVKKAAMARPDDLCLLDENRQYGDKDHFLKPDMLAYMCYADRFGGTLKGVGEKIPYLKDLGITYLHLLSVLEARVGDSDGGFAVKDYYNINSSLGSVDDLSVLARDLRENNISLCIDFVFNHTAKEHLWAKKAMAGDQYYQDFYYIFPDQKEPEKYEKHLPEVFPETAPGNFTYVPEADFWAWTTFYPFQWDLNYKNPDVFKEMLNVMLFLANQGVEVFRLDATAYIWKRLGTDCLNQPETHLLLQAFRALMSIAAPAVQLKAEAIVEARHITKYLGQDVDAEGRAGKKECQLAYHNALMAALWDSLATANVSLMTQMLKNLPVNPKGTAWLTYVRSHDDIGWGVLTGSLQEDWMASTDHLKYISDFYAGANQTSFARGLPFQTTKDAAFHGSNGTLASLAGLEKALEEKDAAGVELALSRIELLYKVIFSFGGIPMIFMGEEIGLLNDYSYQKEKHHADSRWLHRPPMPWQGMDKILAASSPGNRIFHKVKELIRLRKSIKPLHADVAAEIFDCSNSALFCFRRVKDDAIFMLVGNFSDQEQILDREFCRTLTNAKGAIDLSNAQRVDFSRGLKLAPYQCLWLGMTQK